MHNEAAVVIIQQAVVLLLHMLHWLPALSSLLFTSCSFSLNLSWLVCSDNSPTEVDIVIKQPFGLSLVMLLMASSLGWGLSGIFLLPRRRGS